MTTGSHNKIKKRKSLTMLTSIKKYITTLLCAALAFNVMPLAADKHTTSEKAEAVIAVLAGAAEARAAMAQTKKAA